MIEKAARKTLIKRGIKVEDLPIVVHRQRWIAALAIMFVPVVLALGGLGAFFGLEIVPEIIVGGAKAGGVDLLVSLAGAAAWILMFPFCLIAAFLGIDRSFGYHLSIEQEGLRFDGVLTNRLLAWQEIRDIRLKPMVFMPAIDFYQVAHIAIYVDGSNHSRRHWSSLWFGYYDIPPLMETGSKELTALLRHAKRRADLSWPETLPRKIRNSA